MKPAIIVFSGYSGAGKDTAAMAVPNSQVVKFAARGKRVLEHIYGLEEGYLDDRVKRLEVAPYSDGRTYLDVLIDFWEHRDLLVGADLFPNQTAVEMGKVLESGKNLVITDLRNENELDVITDLVHRDHSLYLYWVEGGQARRSDIYSGTLMCKLVPYAIKGKYEWIENEQKGVPPFIQKVKSMLPSHLDRYVAAQ